jgi:hypothetical protein
MSGEPDRVEDEGGMMSYELKTEKKESILWAEAVGTRSVESILSITKDIYKACAENQVKKALIDVRAMAGHLSTMDAYEIPDQHLPKLRDRSVMTQCAIIDAKESEGCFKFFEDVAVNRGFNLRIFTDPDEAVAWLGK